MKNLQGQLPFDFEFDNIKQVQKKYFCLFWKYVKKGSYQKFIIDLKPKKSDDEIDEINLLIRNAYVGFARKSFPGLGDMKIDSGGNTISVENDILLKEMEPSFNRLMVGNHGIYVEFNEPTFDCEFIKKRLQYNEYSRNGFKIYHQFKTVNYADYKIDKWYVDLYNFFGLDVPDYLELLNNKEK